LYHGVRTGSYTHSFPLHQQGRSAAYAGMPSGEHRDMEQIGARRAGTQATFFRDSTGGYVRLYCTAQSRDDVGWLDHDISGPNVAWSFIDRIVYH
jgi:hypothetical protein